KTVELGQGMLMELVRVPGGTFRRGSPGAEPGREENEGPAHEATISRPFYMGVTEVTRLQYEAVMGRREDYKLGMSLPATQVTWEQAATLCRELSRRTGLAVRLPTEAEWEYACRAGTTTAWSFGRDSTLLETCDWPVGSVHGASFKLPNPFGIKGMHGNAREWVWDRYREQYGEGAQRDPFGPEQGARRVVRGGRSAARDGDDPATSAADIGFRVVIGGLMPAEALGPVVLRDFAPGPGGKAATTVVRAAVMNATQKRATCRVVWKVPPGGHWRIDPATRAVDLAPGARDKLAFKVSFTGRLEDLSPLPGLSSGSARKPDRMDALPVSLDVPQLGSLLPRQAVCGFTDRAPKVDGSLDDAAWQKVPPLAKFLGPFAETTVPQPTEVRLCHDAQNLYLAIRCREDPNRMDSLNAMEGPHDGAVYEDECVEVFTVTDPEAGRYFQFVVNAVGSTYDGEGWDSKWNGKWTAKTGREKGAPKGTGPGPAWTVELAIPFDTIGLKPPPAGGSISLNVIRTRIADEPERSMWSPVFGPSNHAPLRAGKVVFQGKRSG
ncbi:MAG TPA: SUMF1/EgtB/PvdO family nonheme iron enzyme, partial [Phycisphaerae bacterium]|nr:SUMF1/EgtB/PvdO family nonheme iron enzyme [Phycisphaerae bacterium]